MLTAWKINLTVLVEFKIFHVYLAPQLHLVFLHHLFLWVCGGGKKSDKLPGGTQWEDAVKATHNNNGTRPEADVQFKRTKSHETKHNVGLWFEGADGLTVWFLSPWVGSLVPTAHEFLTWKCFVLSAQGLFVWFLFYFIFSFLLCVCACFLFTLWPVLLAFLPQIHPLGSFRRFLCVPAGLVLVRAMKK